MDASLEGVGVGVDVGFGVDPDGVGFGVDPVGVGFGVDPDGDGVAVQPTDGKTHPQAPV